MDVCYFAPGGLFYLLWIGYGGPSHQWVIIAHNMSSWHACYTPLHKDTSGIIENTLNLNHLRNEEGGEDLAASQTCTRPWRREAPPEVRMRRIIDNFRSRRAPVTHNQQLANSQCAYRLHWHSYQLGHSVARTRLFPVPRYM